MDIFFSILISLAILFVLFVLFSFVYFRKNFAREKNIEKAEKNFYRYLENCKCRTVAENIRKAKENFENIKYENVSVMSIDECPLAGKLYLNKSSSGKAVILCHGFKSRGETDFGIAFKMYRDMNYNILLIDQRAHGKSDGKYSTMGIMESYDIVTWCKWLEMCFGTENDIIIHGVDMGAFAAFAAGANPEMPKNIKCIIADSIYPLIHAVISKNAEKNLSFLAKPTVRFMNLFFRNTAGFDMRDFSLYAIAKSEKIPVLFIHSENDSTSTISNVEAVMKRMTASSEMVRVQKSPHAVCFAKDENLCVDSIKKFIGEQ